MTRADFTFAFVGGALLGIGTAAPPEFPHGLLFVVVGGLVLVAGVLSVLIQERRP